MKNVISTEFAPKAIGPYAQGTTFSDFVFTSGQIPVNPQTGEISAGIEAQTKQALDNLKAVVEAGGSKKENIVKTVVYLKDMNDFVKMNEVYAHFFGAPFPARTTVEVARLPKDVLVEIEAIAIKDKEV